jgi:hypothetical protein
MTERSFRHDSPETMMINLLGIAGGDIALQAARGAQGVEGFDMEAEARAYAQMGILSISVAFVYAAKELRPLEQIETTRQMAELAKQVIEKRTSEEKKIAQDNTALARAGIIIREVTEYLQAKQVKA